MHDTAMLTLAQIVLWTLVSIPLLLVLLVLVAAMFGAYSFRQSIRFASLSACPRCGKVLGRSAVLAAKDAFSKKMDEMRKQHPGLKLRIVAEWEISCPSCGSIIYFYPGSNKSETQSRFAKSVG